MPDAIINPAALEPLYLPWEEPNAHRVRAKREGDPAVHEKGRRPSTIAIAQNLRQAVSEWRQADYAYGCSETTRELLLHWFWRAHRVPGADGNLIEFNYYFCQREAIETLIYLMEVRRLTTLSAITAEFGGANAEIAALGINPDEDTWSRYAFKVATGAGKTKIMSLAVVWSYFHALRESDSTMAKHFVVIAPNLTVFERLKEDFEYGKIFDKDPLIPPAWKGDWNLSVVLQDEASGAATGGTLYLTNIHRLYDPKRRGRGESETYDWMGPAVSKAKALDMSEALRERVTSHPRLMVLNDEAHHVWDPDSAWNEALSYLDTTLRERTGSGLTAQLDFSATPKDFKGNLFKYIVCDAPLGEAVDAGIVKTPIIGRGQGLQEGIGDDAADIYAEHLNVGYQRWLKSKEEWDKSGKKALMFVMCADTEDADQIARRLNTDPLFEELNGKTINLHTNLKGKLKKRGKVPNVYYEFVEDEKEISDDDLKELRKLSRDLDQDTSPYRCIVSVLMLREGWDVRNVTTIVPLRALKGKGAILAEQTLGRGLRRMTLPGQAAEVVTVVEHPAFVNLYKDELAQEGLPIEIVDVDKVPRTTVSIFPDGEHKDLQALDLLIPRLAAAYSITPQLGEIKFEEIKKAFARFEPLPLGEEKKGEIKYEGRHLLTNEIVEQMNIKLPLLQSGVGAISFFREELERITKTRGTHAKLAPLLQRFIEEVLFTEKTSIFDQRLVHRLADFDVREHIRAVFVPLIRAKTTNVQKRTKTEEPKSVSQWNPFQVTHSERRPTLPAERTPFNLVPCNHGLEVALVRFLERASDIVSFAKNTGPQALHIDYLAGAGRLAFYTPDFFLRTSDGKYYLTETKGREDIDVPAKARAAVEWCRSASTQGVKWSYLYLPEKIFQSFNGNRVDELARACAPALADLIHEADTAQMALPLYEATAGERAAELDEFISSENLAKLPSRYRKAIEEAVGLFGYLEKKVDVSLLPAFQPLLEPLDDAASSLILDLLAKDVPTTPIDQQDYFDPYYSGVSEGDKKWLRQNADNLRKTLVYKNGVMPLGLLAFCLGYPKNKDQVGGVFASIRKRFAPLSIGNLAGKLNQIKEFRNHYLAHPKERFMDAAKGRQELKQWIEGVQQIYWAHH